MLNIIPSLLENPGHDGSEIHIGNTLPHSIFNHSVNLPRALIVEEAICSLLKLFRDSLRFFMTLKPCLVLLMKLCNEFWLEFWSNILLMIDLPASFGPSKLSPRDIADMFLVYNKTHKTMYLDQCASTAWDHRIYWLILKENTMAWQTWSRVFALVVHSRLVFPGMSSVKPRLIPY